MNKKAVVNIKNTAEYCFLWSIMAGLYPIKNNAHSITSYPDFRNVLKYEGINFPIRLKDVPKFKKINGLKINIYGLERVDKSKEEIVLVYLSENFSKKDTIHLLLINKFDASSVKNRNDDNDINKVTNNYYHFTWIRNLSRFVRSQITKNNCRTWLCDRCLCYFIYENSLLKHKTFCTNLNNCKINLPTEEESI